MTTIPVNYPRVTKRDFDNVMEEERQEELDDMRWRYRRIVQLLATKAGSTPPRTS